MAGAIRREGWDLVARVDFSEIKTANQLTNEWRAELEKAEKALSQLKVPRTLAKNLTAAGDATAKAADQVQKLYGETGKLGSSGATSVREYSSELDKASTATSQAQKSADGLAKSYSKMSSAASNAAKQSSTAAQDSAKRLEDRYSKFGKKIKTAVGIATAGLGAGMVAAIKKGTASAAGLQQTYRTIQNLAVTGGESSAEAIRNVTAMQREGQAMSVRYGKSQQEIAEGYEDLVKRGYTTGQALSALTSEVQASIASGDSLNDTYSVTSKVLEGFSMRSGNSRIMLANTKKVVNELAYAADLTSTGFSDLGYGMSYASSVAKQANISLSQTAASLGILSNNGLESTRAGTGLRTVILRLQSDIAKFGKTKKNGKSESVLQGLGIDKDQVMKSDGSLRSLSTVMGTLQAAVEKTYPKNKTMQANVFKTLFGTEGVNAAEILAQNAAEVDELAKKVKKAGEQGNYVQELAAKNSGTAKVQAQSAKQALEAFEMTLGNAVLPSLNKASQELAKFLTSKDGKKFQKDVADVVAKFANGLVSFIEWLPSHTGEVKGFAITLAGLWGTTKIVSWIKWVGTAKSAFLDLKNVVAGINSGTLFAGAPKVAPIASTAGATAGATQTATAAAGQAGAAAGQAGAAGATAGAGLLSKVTGVVGKIAPWVGVGISAIDVGTSIASAVKSGSKSQKVAAASKAAGATIGGLIGFAIGGPLGASVGSGIGDTVGSTKFAQNAVNSTLKGNYPQYSYKRTKNGTIVPVVQKPKPKKSAKQKQAESVGNSLQKATEAELKLKVAIDSKSLKSSAKQLKSAYKNIFQIGQNNSRKKQKSEEDTLTQMYKSGVISKKRYEKLMSDVKSKEEGFRSTNKQNYASLTKDIKQETSERTKAYNAYYKGLAKTGKKGAKTQKQLEQQLNKSLKKIDEKYSSDERSRAHNLQKYMVSSWATKNSKELSQLETSIKRKKKLTKAEARSLVSQTESATSKVIANAEKRKNSTISSAHKEYTQTKSKYWKLYHEEGVISKSEYEAAKDQAWKKYRTTKKAATDTANAVEKKAKKQRDSVKKYAEKEAGDYRTAWQKTKDWFKGLWSDLSTGWNNFWKSVNKNAKPNYSFLEGQDEKLGQKYYHPAKTKRTKQATGGYAVEQRATGGYVAASRYALVGEAGPELAYRVGGTKARILGANGPEMTKISAGEHILNAKDTAKAMTGGIGKGLVLNGYAKGTAKLVPGATAAGGATPSAKPANNLAGLEKSSLRSWINVSLFTSKKGKKSSRSGRAVSARAVGGPIQRSQHALVGEEGPELAYTKYGKARILGLNGPQITAVYRDEHILTAKQTAKALGSGFGRGKVLPGYAKGTGEAIASFAAGTSSRQATGVSSIKLWSKVSKETSKETKQTRKKSVSDYTTMRKGILKQVTGVSSSSTKLWSKVSKNTDKETNRTRKNSISDYTTMRKGVLKQMDHLQDGVTSSAKATASNFGDALDKMHTYARRAMSKTVSQLNNGIQSIDKVLSQFGGNSQVIKPVHFAQGTRHGHLTRDTLAVVNDAKSGPRQEAIVRSGKVYLPKGRDTLIPLKRGDEVLNGTQTQELAHTWGLPHFAQGSGVSKSRLRSIAKQGDANPGKAFNQDFGLKIKPAGPKFEQGTDSLAKNSAKSYGVPWMKAIWDVIVEKIGSGAGRGGTREAFEKYAEAHFMGKPYRMGASGPTYYDCSGMVSTALRHFGIDIGRTTVAMQSSGGVTHLGRDISKTTAGDLVIFGHGSGAAGHVGIVKNPATGTMFNETPPSARVSRISDDTSMGYGYYRVNALHDASKKKNKTDSKLKALAKRELGPSALKWIEKNLADPIASAGSANLTGDQGARVRQLAKLFKKADSNATKAGIAAIVGNWLFESGLNAGAVNPSGGASGLGQWLGGRKANLIAFAKKHGTSWSNAGTQVSFAVSGEGSDSAILRRILEGHGSVASLANAFSSQWERGGYNAQHVAGAEKAAGALGYASGGNPPAGNIVKVGERGPELAEFKQPVHIYSASETKRKEREVTKLSKISGGKSGGFSGRFSGSKPTINININGNISSENDAMKYAKLIKQELTNLLSDISDEYGLDPSFY